MQTDVVITNPDLLSECLLVHYNKILILGNIWNKKHFNDCKVFKFSTFVHFLDLYFIRLLMKEFAIRLNSEKHRYVYRVRMCACLFVYKNTWCCQC